MTKASLRPRKAVQKPAPSRRPRSRPPVWRATRVRQPKWRFRDPRGGPAKGRTDLGTRVRRLLWTWWIWGLATVALVATPEWPWAFFTGALSFLSHLITPQVEPPRFGLDHAFPLESDEFIITMAGATGVPYVAGNSLEFLNNGDAFYPRMLADIRHARRTITIEAYIYWAGRTGTEFAQALAARARAGVRVMVLLDAVGSADIGDETLAMLEAGGCHVAWYNPIRWKTIGRFNNRTHRKSLIVDGAVAYTGGAGIADPWCGDARGPDEWRDIQIRFAGPAVIGLQSGFARNWQEATGELVSGEAYYPRIAPQGPHALQVILSSPETGGSSVQTMYYLAIACARRTIFIANSYFIPDAVAVDMLVEAVARGVDVRVMVSGVRNDNWLARHNSVRRYGRLLRAGVRLFEYNRSMLHHKAMVVDGAWITIGTTNFDNRSFAHNEESNVCAFDRTLAAELERTFLLDQSICEPVRLEAWRRRGLAARASEMVAALLEDQV